MDPISIYWAGPRSSQAERIWNRLCAEHLRAKGYQVILPQDEAEKFRGEDGIMNSQALARHCEYQAIEHDVMVAILDGANPDSGTSVEVGLRIREGGIIIGMCTDSEDGPFNAIFHLIGNAIRFSALNESYKILCDAIDQKVQSILRELTEH